MSGVCFGSIGIFIRFFSEAGFNNMAILTTRNAISALILFLFMLIYDRNLLKCRVRDLPILLGGGFIGMTLTNVFYNLAVLHLSLGFAGVLIGLSPVYVVFIAAFLFRERITTRKLLGMILAVVGVVMVSGVIVRRPDYGDYDGAIRQLGNSRCLYGRGACLAYAADDRPCFNRRSASVSDAECFSEAY